MSASVGLTLVTTLLYAATSAAHLYGGRRGMAIAFAAYALANVGLIVAELER